MNRDSDELVSESEIREALAYIKPDPNAFEEGVRHRMEAMLSLRERNGQSRDVMRNEEEDSTWLRLAACVVPFPVAGKLLGGSAPLSLVKFSLYYKLIGYLALPAIGFFLAIGATLFGLFHMRKTQRGSRSDALKESDYSSAVLRWWRQFAWLPLAWFLLAFAFIKLGYALPVFLVFLTSGVATVALVSRLGRAGLVDRQVIASCISPSLIMFAQIALAIETMDGGLHLIDQSIIPALLFGSGIALSMSRLWKGGREPGVRSTAIFIALLFALIGTLLIGSFCRSYWQPITTHTLQRFVESFDKARFSSASWERWSIPARWLQETNVALDLTKPQKLARLQIAGEKNPFILGNAIEANLFEPSDLAILRQLDKDGRLDRLLDVQLKDQPINSLFQTRYRTYVLQELNELSDDDLDLLESRLLANLREATNIARQDLQEAWAATILLERFGRPCKDESVRDSVGRLLVDLQRVSFRFGVDRGGFARFPQLKSGELETTAFAVELMQRYGVPDKLNVLALRNYLRPTNLDRPMIDKGSIRDEGAIRTATRQRLNSLPDVPPVSWWDIVWLESNLWMTLMILLLSFFAVFGSPNRTQSR